MDKALKDLMRFLAPLPTALSPAGRIHAPLKAILFDIYGTLFISGSGDIGVAHKRFDPSDALDALCERYQVPWSPTEMTRKLFAAIKQTHRNKKAVGVDHPEIEIDRIWQRILKWPDMGRIRQMAEAYEWIVNPTYPMPGLDPVLRTLRGRGILLGIISNAQFFTPRLFETFLGADTEQLGFAPDLTFYSYEHGCAKPSRTLFDRAASRLENRGIAPGAVLYVGNDMRNDVHPAGQAGFQTALFAGDRRSLRLHADDPVISKTRPDLIVTDLRQILDAAMPEALPATTTI
jgi:putative hydrolase of the HAD superfamily